jgi:DNA repair exonuclease SbcCD ATPase subunit
MPAKEEEQPEVKRLVALELRPNDDQYDVWIFDEANSSEENAQKLNSTWAKNKGKDKDVELPTDTAEHQAKPLRASEEFLFGGFQPEQKEIASRIVTEWLFICASHKAFLNYCSEIEELKQRITNLNSYDRTVFEELKTFSKRVQEQVQEKNIFKEQADKLKETIDLLFEDLKHLRAEQESSMNEDFKKAMAVITAKLDSLEEQLNSDKTNLTAHFNELKGAQVQMHELKLGRDNRKIIVERLDKLFNKNKELRFGDSAGNPSSHKPTGSFGDHLAKRIEGLQKVIDNIQESIDRDLKENEYLEKRIQSGNATQMEAQLRQAKASLVQERVKSKQLKLDDMNTTMQDLQKQLAKITKKRPEKTTGNAENTNETVAATNEAPEVVAATNEAPEVVATINAEATTTPSNNDVVENTTEGA